MSSKKIAQTVADVITVIHKELDYSNRPNLSKLNIETYSIVEKLSVPHNIKPRLILRIMGYYPHDIDLLESKIKVGLEDITDTHVEEKPRKNKWFDKLKF